MLYLILLNLKIFIHLENLFCLSDDCVSTRPFQPATTFNCPDKCPRLGNGDFTGNVADD